MRRDEIEADLALGQEGTALHEAMRRVLQTAPGRRILAAELDAHIYRRGLYKMRNGRKS